MTATASSAPTVSRWGRRLRWVAAAAALAGIDLTLKAWAQTTLAGAPIEAGPVDLKLAFNPGAAFSIAADAPSWVMLTLTTVITTAVAVGGWVVAPRANLLTRVALAAILGGAAANVIDRAPDGVVTDYLHTGWWPTFNLADTFIVLGATALIIATLIGTPMSENHSHPNTTPTTGTEPGPSRRWAGLAALVVALLTVGLDLMVLNVALPTLAQDLGASTTQLQWIVNAYTLVFAALMLPAGGFGDRYGRKRLLLIGLVAFVAASAWAAFSGSTGSLIAARAVMGIGAAIIVPLSLGILPTLFGPDQRRRAIAVWVGALGVGLPLGPIVGGWLLQHFWWGSVFLINVPVGVAALVACVVLLPESVDPHAPALDWLGILTAVPGTAALVFGIIQAPAYGWTDPVVLAALAAGVWLIAGFLVWESRARDPLVDLALFTNPAFTWPTLAATAGTFTLVGVLFVLPQYLQILRYHDAFGTGLRLVPLVLAIIVAAAAVDKIVTRLGAKIPIATGMVIAAAGFVLASRITVDSGYGFVAVCLATVGLGAGLALAPAVDAVMASLPEHRSAAGAGLLMAIRQVGAAFSVAILGTLLTVVYTRDLDPHLSGLPEPVVSAARDNIAGAQLAATQIPGPAGADLAASSAHAYSHAMSAVFLASAAISALLAAAIAAKLPNHTPAPAPTSPARDRN